MAILMTVRREWKLFGPGGERGKLPPGTHKMERIRCPDGHDCDWLVLEGTQLGAAEGFWRDWGGEDYDDFRITFDEAPTRRSVAPARICGTKFAAMRLLSGIAVWAWSRIRRPQSAPGEASATSGWSDPCDRMPERGEAVEWQDSAGDIVRGTFAGVWLMDNGTYVYYTPKLWRPAAAA